MVDYGWLFLSCAFLCFLKGNMYFFYIKEEKEGFKRKKREKVSKNTIW